MNANGHLITDGYKLPKLSLLTRSKRNGKANDKKRLGNSKNAVTRTASAINASESTSINHLGSQMIHSFPQKIIFFRKIRFSTKKFRKKRRENCKKNIQKFSFSAFRFPRFSKNPFNFNKNQLIFDIWFFYAIRKVPFEINQ